MKSTMDRALIVMLAAAIFLLPIAASVEKAAADNCTFTCSQTCVGVDTTCECAGVTGSCGGTYLRYTEGVVLTIKTGGTQVAELQAELFCYYVASCTDGETTYFTHCASGATECGNTGLYVYCRSCPPVAGNVPVKKNSYECSSCPP